MYILIRMSVALPAVALSACGQGPEPVVADPSGMEGIADAGSVVMAATATCVAGQTEACTCLAPGSSGPTTGTRGCSGGLWLGCTCGQSAPAMLQDECLAGRYEGSFSGVYRSGFAAGLPIPVTALDLAGKPGLSFTLLKKESFDQEFPTYTVSNGFVEGTSDGVSPFDGTLTGTLDCRTRRFMGELDGHYSVFVPLGVNEGTFKGPVSGEYDVATHSFKLGIWNVKENEEVGIDLLGEAGGEGDWDAKYAGP